MGRQMFVLEPFALFGIFCGKKENFIPYVEIKCVSYFKGWAGVLRILYLQYVLAWNIDVVSTCFRGTSAIEILHFIIAVVGSLGLMKNVDILIYGIH